MNRKIKFRAFDKRVNKIREVINIDFTAKYVILQVDDEYKTHCFFEEIELMQFTGLYDKNGKEIYEGDLLKGGIYLAYEVLWDDEDNGWNVKNEYSIKNDYEIIGNIHENKDLLK